MLSIVASAAARSARFTALRVPRPPPRRSVYGVADDVARRVSYELAQHRHDAPVYALIAANVAVFLAHEFVAKPNPRWRRWYNRHFVLSNSRFRADPLVLLSSNFAHVGLVHLAMNMFTLYSFGRSTLSMLGPARFLGLYAAAGAAGSAAHLAATAYLPRSRWPAAATTGRDDAAVGASGAIAGLVCYTATRAWRGSVYVFIVPVPNAVFVPAFVLGSLYLTLFQGGAGHWAHAAHAGGALTGVAYAAARTIARR